MDNNYDVSPIIGHDIPWDAIRGGSCRVKHFTPFATVESGKIKSAQLGLPYGSLSVDLPKGKYINLPDEADMPVTNKDDFLRLWHIFKERGINSGEEVIVFYEPFFRNSFTSRLMPRLHIYIFPEGFHDGNENLRPIDIYEPKFYKYHRR